VICKSCGEDRPAEAFNTRTRGDCLRCIRRRASLKYYYSHIEVVREYTKKYNSNNRGAIAIKSRAFREKNKERLKARAEELRKLNPEKFKETQFAGHIKRRYGLTVDRYKQIMFEQNGGCAICKRPFSGMKQRPHIDHSHKTGTVRGILCNPCNSGIGYFHENIERMISGIEYVGGWHWLDYFKTDKTPAP
jgi:hypothetical protein